MSMNNSASGLTTASSSLTRLPFLASPSLHFNLADDLSELRNHDSWKRNSVAVRKHSSSIPISTLS